MLMKLIKHEWKDTRKVGGLFLLILLLVTFFGWLAFQSPMWKSIDSNVESTIAGTFADIMSVFTLMMYIFMLVGLTYGILIYFAVHFYKTMYTDQGYLIHTLPVTKHQILGSKILVNSLWYIIIMLGIVVSAMLLLLSLVGAVMPEGYTLASLWHEVSAEMDVVLTALKNDLGLDLRLWIVYMFAAILIGTFASIIIIYSAITLGQLFTKHRVLMAIVIYIAIAIVQMLLTFILDGVTSAANLMSMITNLADYNNYIITKMFSGLIMNVIFAAVMYFVSHYVISKKLNME